MYRRRSNINNLILVIICFQTIVDITVLLDIPVLRQILGLIYLVVVPGTAILTRLRLDGVGFAQKSLIAVGLSLASIMIVGLVLNSIGLAMQAHVLSSWPLLLSLNTLVLIFCAASYRLDKHSILNTSLPKINLPMVAAILLPLLSVIGAFVGNTTGNSVISVLVIPIVLSFLVLGLFKYRNWMPFCLLMITIALLFQASLVTNYIVGYDVHIGYHVFRSTQTDRIWISTINETDPLVPRNNQMLSVTILPTTFSAILSLDGTTIFKIIYPLLFAFVPFGLLQLYQAYLDKRSAIIAAFLTFSSIVFISEMPGLPTQMIGEIFLVLLLTVIFSKNIHQTTRLVLFTVFSFGMVASHYGLSYVFMFTILLAWLIPVVQKKSTKIQFHHIVLFSVLAFCWYIYTAHSASFNTFTEMGQNIYSSFWTDLLNPGSRAESALRGVGLGESASSLGHWIGRAFHYAIQLFIVIGVLFVSFKRRLFKFDTEYLVIAFFMLIFALSPLIAPSFNLLNMNRTYHISLLLLAPFCVIGGEKLFSELFKRFSRIELGNKLSFLMTFTVIVCLFLFETGLIYEVTDDVSYSAALSAYRMDRTLTYGYGYLSTEKDVMGATWFRSNIVLTSNTTIQGDVVSAIKSPLTSYAGFPLDHLRILTNVTKLGGSQEFAFLRSFNTQDELFFGEQGASWNSSDFRPMLEESCKIYDNGGTAILAGYGLSG